MNWMMTDVMKYEIEWHEMGHAQLPTQYVQRAVQLLLMGVNSISFGPPHGAHTRVASLTESSNYPHTIYLPPFVRYRGETEALCNFVHAYVNNVKFGVDFDVAFQRSFGPSYGDVGFQPVTCNGTMHGCCVVCARAFSPLSLAHTHTHTHTHTRGYIHTHRLFLSLFCLFLSLCLSLTHSLSGNAHRAAHGLRPARRVCSMEAPSPSLSLSSPAPSLSLSLSLSLSRSLPAGLRAAGTNAGLVSLPGVRENGTLTLPRQRARSCASRTMPPSTG